MNLKQVGKHRHVLEGLEAFALATTGAIYPVSKCSGSHEALWLFALGCRPSLGWPSLGFRVWNQDGAISLWKLIITEISHWREKRGT